MTSQEVIMLDKIKSYRNFNSRWRIFQLDLYLFILLMTTRKHALFAQILTWMFWKYIYMDFVVQLFVRSRHSMLVVHFVSSLISMLKSLFLSNGECTVVKSNIFVKCPYTNCFYREKYNAFKTMRF